MPLTTAANIREPGAPQRWPHAAGDAFYDALIAAHEGLTDAQSALLNARLVLLLANHVGDLGALREAIALARAGVDQAA
jgi:Protein of unknown function (DUF2783)